MALPCYLSMRLTGFHSEIGVCILLCHTNACEVGCNNDDPALFYVNGLSDLMEIWYLVLPKSWRTIWFTITTFQKKKKKKFIHWMFVPFFSYIDKSGRAIVFWLVFFFSISSFVPIEICFAQNESSLNRKCPGNDVLTMSMRVFNIPYSAMSFILWMTLYDYVPICCARCPSKSAFFSLPF